MLREYVEAMRALWTQEEASYDGEFVSFGPSWAYPKPAQPHIPLIIGAGGGPKTFRWIAAHADGWMTTPTQQTSAATIEALTKAWADAGREGAPDIRVLIAFKPDPDDLDGLGRGRRHRADLGRPRQAPRTRCWPPSTASPPASASI